MNRIKIFYKVKTIAINFFVDKFLWLLRVSGVTFHLGWNACKEIGLELRTVTTGKRRRKFPDDYFSECAMHHV